MKSRIRIWADGALKILSILVAVYLICSISYQNRHLAVPVSWLLWILIALVLADGIMYIAGGYRENVLIYKIVRGLIWAVTVCACNIRGCVALLTIALAMLLYMSGQKRNVLDIPFTGMVCCICMECISLAGLLFYCEYPPVGSLLLDSQAVDVLFILSVICYMNAEKVTEMIVKLPSIENKTGMTYLETGSNEETEVRQRKVAAGILLFGIFLGLYVYSVFFAVSGLSHILECVVAVVLQLVILYAVYRGMFPELSRADIWLIALAAICLHYAYYGNWDRKEALAGIVCFALFGCMRGLFWKHRFRWVTIYLMQIAVTVYCFWQGIYVVPFVSITVGIVLGKLVLKRYGEIAVLCALFVVCGQVVVGVEYIVPEATYHDLAVLCTTLETDTGSELCYMGDNAELVKSLNKEGIMLKGEESRSEASIEIYDSSVDMGEIILTNCLYSDGSYYIVTRSSDIAELYAENGGSWYRIVPETEISAIDNGTLINFEIIGNLDGYSEVRVGVWSAGDLSDIEWFVLSKKEWGVYTVDFDIAGYEGDTIYMHVYGELTDGMNDYLGNTEYSFIK